jgi:alginate O-acetyltransferase complex protein AlgI
VGRSQLPKISHPFHYLHLPRYCCHPTILGNQMPFNSVAYALLLTITGFSVALTPWPAAILMVASFVFYAIAGPFDTAVFLSAVAVNWLIQIGIAAGRWRIAAAAVVNVSLIGYFKYHNLFMGYASQAGSYIDTALPLGISFYSLQALAYHIDVSRKVSAPARSLPEFFLFKAFFPQLIAGPIVRAHQVLPQIKRLIDHKPRRHRLIVFGLGLIALGLTKKVVFADSLAPLVDDIFGARKLSAFTAWLGAILFSFQIYFDFSGYSDIAIGSSYLLGIRLPWNFRTPYLSMGPREFWQRWHISLSTWIRDYLYIPLGGGRGNPVRTVLVLLVTMSIAGLWHGANWTFVAWGAAWGFYLLIGRTLPLNRAPVVLMWPAHMIVVICLWVLFRSPSLGFAVDYLATMMSFQSGPPAPPDDAAPFGMVIAGIVGLFTVHWAESLLQNRRVLYLLRHVDGPVARGLLAGLAFMLVLIPTYNVNPFIYFRF